MTSQSTLPPSTQEKIHAWGVRTFPLWMRRTWTGTIGGLWITLSALGVLSSLFIMYALIKTDQWYQWNTPMLLFLGHVCLTVTAGGYLRREGVNLVRQAMGLPVTEVQKDNVPEPAHEEPSGMDQSIHLIILDASTASEDTGLTRIVENDLDEDLFDSEPIDISAQEIERARLERVPFLERLGAYLFGQASLICAFIFMLYALKYHQSNNLAVVFTMPIMFWNLSFVFRGLSSPRSTLREFVKFELKFTGLFLLLIPLNVSIGSLGYIMPEAHASLNPYLLLGLALFFSVAALVTRVWLGMMLDKTQHYDQLHKHLSP